MQGVVQPGSHCSRGLLGRGRAASGGVIARKAPLVLAPTPVRLQARHQDGMSTQHARNTAGQGCGLCRRAAAWHAAARMWQQQPAGRTSSSRSLVQYTLHTEQWKGVGSGEYTCRSAKLGLPAYSPAGRGRGVPGGQAWGGALLWEKHRSQCQLGQLRHASHPSKPAPSKNTRGSSMTHCPPHPGRG